MARHMVLATIHKLLQKHCAITSFIHSFLHSFHLTAPSTDLIPCHQTVRQSEEMLDEKHGWPETCGRPSQANNLVTLKTFKPLRTKYCQRRVPKLRIIFGFLPMETWV